MIARADPQAVVTTTRSEEQVIAELQQTVSASRLGTFQRCRLQFYFRYVAELPTRPAPGLYVGKVIHAVLQALNLARWRGVTVTDEDRRIIFDRVFDDSEIGLTVDWNGERDEQKRLAWSSLQVYFRENPVPVEEKPIGVEVALEADLSQHGLPTIIGVVDLVRPNGRLVDYKTTGKTPNQESLAHQHETQTSCYAVLYRASTGSRETGFDLHHLVKLKKEPKLMVTPIAPMNEQRETRLYKVIDSYMTALERRDFIPSPGLQCFSCEFYAQCRAWPNGKEHHHVSGA